MNRLWVVEEYFGDGWKIQKTDFDEPKVFLCAEEKMKTKIWNVGKNYFIRTVTMALTGKLVAVGDNELVLRDAAWIADTGRFSDFVKGSISDPSVEIEPFPDKADVIVGRNSIIDAVVWAGSLPRKTK